MTSQLPALPGALARGSGDTALAGRTAMVTGGGSGIGRACARALAEAGALVHVVDVDAAAARETADAIGGHPHAVDLADGDAVRGLPGEVDVLVNSAGLQHVAAIEDFPPARFEQIQKVMVTAPFLLLQQCLPHMYAAGWGRVVNISSVHGLRASAFKSAYVAAKHALEGLNKVTALEGASRGVTSNCINPGYVRTPLVEHQITSQAEAHGIAPGDVLADVLLKRSAIKRLIEPEEVAAVAVWLCGPHTGYLTGASIPLDGGWGAH
ncbi:3-hydroxybutyrate dehydrogenase [Streptomyces xanthophaeus]|uniref:3-hydroxybutyrate dehydrogenase n=1 Tax=Streptomyces xanthophaeus TaxID=67385 RepID=UPI0004CCA535|nr:3-hydroxybutyrate dehydrogenase [Streptomyces xanthophaeus]